MSLQISLKNSTNICRNTLGTWMWVNTYDSSDNQIDHKKIKHDGRHHHMTIATESGNFVKMKLGLSYETSHWAWQSTSIKNGDVIKFSGGASSPDSYTSGKTQINYGRGTDWTWKGVGPFSSH